MSEKIFLGIDAGSTTLKAVLLSENGKVRHTMYVRTKPSRGERLNCTGRCSECGACSLGSLHNTIEDFLAEAGTNFARIACTVVTGSQITPETKRVLPYDYKTSEVTAHVAGARHYYPDCQAILDVGGQDSKAMIYRKDMNLWLSKMSGICAAGTGAFLDSVAAKLGVPTEDMAKLANYDSELEFSSICAVLSATSINKFKSQVPMSDIIGGACRAQARTIMSGVGEILIGFKGPILFQGGVAYNQAVRHFLHEITGNEIIVPQFHQVMGALGAACIAREQSRLGAPIARQKTPFDRSKLKSVQMRASQTRREFLSHHAGNDPRPLVWRNLFYPAEILNALDVRQLTMETYAALFARNQKRIKKAFDNAAYKGFAGETCTFLRVLEGTDLPKPDFAVSTSEPCQQGERIFRDLARQYDLTRAFYSVNTPIVNDALSVEQIAEGLEASVKRMEQVLGIKMDPSRLAEACELSNQARELTLECNNLRLTSPLTIPGSIMVYFASIFSQLWGKQELVDMQKQLLEDLKFCVNAMGTKAPKIEDQHRAIWLHLPPFYDSEVMNYIEAESHIGIVFEEVNHAGWDKLDPKDPYRSLAKKLLTVGFLDPELRVKTIKETCVKGKLNGAFLYNHGFGRCSMADATFIKHLREELASVKVPLIVLDGDCMDASVDPCSTKTKIQAFAESLNVGRYGNVIGPLSTNPIDKLIYNIPEEKIPFDSVKQVVKQVKQVVKEK